MTGEHETAVSMGYFRQVIPVIKQYFGYIMMEVQPLSVEDYKQLKGLGIEAIICYKSVMTVNVIRTIINSVKRPTIHGDWQHLSGLLKQGLTK